MGVALCPNIPPLTVTEGRRQLIGALIGAGGWMWGSRDLLDVSWSILFTDTEMETSVSFTAEDLTANTQWQLLANLQSIFMFCDRFHTKQGSCLGISPAF